MIVSCEVPDDWFMRGILLIDPSIGGADGTLLGILGVDLV